MVIDFLNPFRAFFYFHLASFIEILTFFNASDFLLYSTVVKL
jgi:hypothetical protein